MNLNYKSTWQGKIEKIVYNMYIFPIVKDSHLPTFTKVALKGSKKTLAANFRHFPNSHNQHSQCTSPNLAPPRGFCSWSYVACFPLPKPTPRSRGVAKSTPTNFKVEICHLLIRKSIKHRLSGNLLFHTNILGIHCFLGVFPNLVSLASMWAMKCL